MRSTWKTIRVPPELAARLDRLAAELMESHVEGRAALPSEFCERVPAHHVISRAVEDWEAHRLRSRAPRAGKVGS